MTLAWVLASSLDVYLNLVDAGMRMVTESDHQQGEDTESQEQCHGDQNIPLLEMVSVLGLELVEGVEQEAPVFDINHFLTEKREFCI